MRHWTSTLFLLALAACVSSANKDLPSADRNKSMNESKVDNERPPFDQKLADTYIGKYILVGITYLDHTGKETSQVQMHGVVESATPEGIRIALRGTRAGQSWDMPPAPEAIHPATPGTYKLRSTGEVIENPDLLSTWSLKAPLKQ